MRGGYVRLYMFLTNGMISESPLETEKIRRRMRVTVSMIEQSWNLLEKKEEKTTKLELLLIASLYYYYYYLFYQNRVKQKIKT